MAYMTSDKIPPVSHAFVSALKRAFRGPSIKPGADRDQIIWDQAQAEVVKWVEQYARTHRLSGAAEDLEKPDETPQPWWRRMFRRWR